MAKMSLDETKRIRVFLSQISAFKDTVQEILTNEKANEDTRYASYKQLAWLYNDLAEKAKDFLSFPTSVLIFDMDKISGYGDTLVPMQKSIMEQVLISTKLLCASLEGNLDFVDDEFEKIQDFIRSRLRTVIYNQKKRFRFKMH